SIGEKYDMYGMTAAHPTLPLPSYARVTSVASGRSVVVRVNDRGPFLHGRIVDLSYAAAHRLGIAQRGSGEVVVESLLAGGETVASVAPVLATPVPAAAGKPDPAEAPVQSAAGGFVVQLGAFARRAASIASTSDPIRRAMTRDARRTGSRAHSGSPPPSHHIEFRTSLN